MKQHQDKQSRIREAIRIWLAGQSTTVLAFIPVLFAALIFILLAMMVGRASNRGEKVPMLFSNSMVGIASIVVSLSGVVMILRQEAPISRTKYIRGKPAILIGIVQIVLWAGLGAITIVSAIMGW